MTKRADVPAAELEFESMGLLRMVQVPPQYAWLSDAEKFLLVHMALYTNADGMPLAVLKNLQKQHVTEEVVSRTYVNGLVEWLTDKTGAPAAIALTWEGRGIAQMLLSIARTSTKPSPPRRPKPPSSLLASVFVQPTSLPTAATDEHARPNAQN